MYKNKKGMKNMKEIKLGTYIHNDETHNFYFATDLSASEKISFINSVVDTVVRDNYYAVIRNLMFDYVLIQTFTDVNTSFIGKSENAIDTIEQFLRETNIVDIVKSNIEDGLLEQLEDAVDKAVEYRTGIHPSPIADSLGSLLSTLERKFGEIDLGGVMDMVQKFVGLTGEFTPESIVDAYMNSDIHQKNLEEIAEAKNIKVE
jgi:hypothetical protein